MGRRGYLLNGGCNAIILTLVLLLVSCGDRKLQTGAFLDSAVEGLSYNSESVSGDTNESGFFQYRTGETVSFYLNELFLGSAAAEPVLTPLDIVESATDVTHDRVTNIARLLQTLDQNNDLEDGIQLIPLALNTPNSGIDLSVDQLDFADDSALQAYLAIVKPDDSKLVGISDAQDHLRQTLSGLDPATPISVQALVDDNNVNSNAIVRLTGEVNGEVEGDIIRNPSWTQDSDDEVMVKLTIGSDDPDSLLGETQAEFTAPTETAKIELNFTFTAESEDGTKESDTVRVTVNPSE